MRASSIYRRAYLPMASEARRIARSRHPPAGGTRRRHRLPGSACADVTAFPRKDGSRSARRPPPPPPAGPAAQQAPLRASSSSAPAYPPAFQQAPPRSRLLQWRYAVVASRALRGRGVRDAPRLIAGRASQQALPYIVYYMPWLDCPPAGEFIRRVPITRRSYPARRIMLSVIQPMRRNSPEGTAVLPAAQRHRTPVPSMPARSEGSLQRRSRPPQRRPPP